MYLKRKIDKFLVNWKNDENHLPLIVRGARQVGKTEAIRFFAKSNYKYLIEINFVENPQYKGIIEEGFNIDSIIKLISRMNPLFKFIKGETLIFFDEIQEFPEITTALKFFKQDNRFDVICSGSMLGIQQKRIESTSVGYKTDFIMRSFDFEEFLWAMGYPEEIADDFLFHMQTNKPFAEIEIKKYFSIYLDYILIGGMPAVVKDFAERKNFENTLTIQKQLLLDYQEDIKKYAEGLDKSKILSVFNSIPIQLAKENKKFQISKIIKGARSREYFGCVQWLLDAGVISICHCLNFPELPLKGNYEESKYKLYIADTGILIAMLDEEAVLDLRTNKNLAIYKGALYENFVAEAMTKSGYELFYYKSEKSNLEEDFFVRTQKNLIPIEVKSENSVSKSLRMLIVSENYPDIAFGIKFAHANIGKTDTLTTFPYFCSFLLKRYINSLT